MERETPCFSRGSVIAVGLPLEGIAVILAVDRFLDMFRTSVNVWGDLVGAKIINRLMFKSSENPKG